MAAGDKIRSQLIDKTLAIKNKDFLEALDQLVASGNSSSDLVELTSEQKEMLEMSDKDIENGRLISQQAMKEILNG